jgi:CSLREA domain-containing protein
MSPVKRNSLIRPALILVILAFMVSVPLPVAAIPAAAFYVVVDTFTDDPTKSACALSLNDCSLRGAISYANATAPGSEVHITIPAGTYTLALGGAGEDANATGDLDILYRIVYLQGAGRNLTILDGNGLDRVLDSEGTSVSVTDLNIINGMAPAGDLGGGAILNHGGRTMALENVLIDGNSVLGTDSADSGGGISNYGILTMTNSTIHGNSACNGGGIVSTGASLTMQNSFVDGNHVSDETNCGDGGGIATRTSADLFNLSHVTVEGNTADRGGGIFYNGLVNGVIVDSYIHGNTSSNNGAGLYNYGDLTLERVTVADNQANGNGGGIVNSKTLELLNVTVSGNSAVNGGGLYNSGSSTIAMDHCTIAGNTASVAGTAYYGWTGSGTTLHNSIFAGATAGKTWGNEGIATMINQGYNLCSDDSCPLSDIYHDLENVDPKLGSLANYHGASPTLPLLAGSPAIDAADSAITLSSDQRGFPRVDGDRDGSVIADIGAFEYSAVIWLPLVLKTP